MTLDLLRVLASATFAASAAIVLLLALRKPLRAVGGARAAYALWALVPLAALAAAVPAPRNFVLPQLPVPGSVLAAMTAAAAPSWHWADAAPWLAGAWLLGALVLLVQFMRQQRRFLNCLGRLRAIGADVVIAEASTGIPALIGAWRPRIALPADFVVRYEPGERALILAHERCHRRRGDAQFNALAALLRCLFWFDPLIHIAASRFRFDQELACDAAVITRFPEARRRYARAMLKAQLADPGLPVGCFWQSVRPLQERITMLKHLPPGRARTASGRVIAAVLIIAGTVAASAVQKIAAAATGAPPVAAAAEFADVAPPHYPPAAIQAHQQGKITLRIVIDERGTPLSAAVYAADPPEAESAFGAASIEAALRWRFKPRLEAGRAVASTLLVPITYGLDDED